LKCKNLSEENRVLRQASVNIQAQAEQEEEFISNTLLKKIHSLKKEKEALALNYEQEEEFLTNDLSRKLSQLRQEKVQLEQTLEQEQEHQVSKLMKKIEKLEKEVIAKQSILEQLRREKIDLENTLEQEQEMLVNRLWKRMDKVEAEKRDLEAKVGTTPPPSPSDRTDPALLNSRITQLLREVQGLRRKLADVETKHKTKMQEIGEEEKALKEENVRLQKKLQRETERSEALSRALSESESNLEIDEERMFNEMTAGRGQHSKSPVSFSPSPTRRSVSPSSIVLANTSAFNPPSPYLGRGHHRTSSLETNQVHMHSPLHSSSGSSLTAPVSWCTLDLVSVEYACTYVIQYICGDKQTLLLNIITMNIQIGVS
jgi:coiled-coil domain-containing protein 6